MEFLNRFLLEKVHLIKGLGFKLKYDNINMPEESVAPIDKWLKSRLTVINKPVTNVTVKREISKLLGKFLLLLIELTLLFYVTAIAFVLYTGCRPIEAAYIVLHKTVQNNNYKVKHAKFQYKASAPKSITKTKRDYFWLLPK